MDTWQVLENKVKTISSFLWNCNAINETINGVKIDCVLKPNVDRWIIIEITENHSLDKIRADITKISSCRQFLFSRNIYCEAYIVMRDEPTETMYTTGDGVNIKVLSYNSFSKLFIDYPTYTYIRNQRIFGSSVNPISGEADSNNYTPVFYENIRTKSKVSINDIAKFLLKGRRIVLLGNYGTGKSRCIRELFNILIERQLTRVVYPLAINLKENWGNHKAEEIIRRHFSLLGLSHMGDSAVKIIEKNSFILLLDGFDEVAAQVWSDDPSKLKQIRSSSLSAIKDLIKTTKSPVIITGREHYFNSNDEMFEAIGLEKNETELIRCKDEFTVEEMHNYLQTLSITIDIPIWLPRRPLICQIINTLEKEKIENILIETYSASEFWETLIKSICIREARISTILDAEKIYSILKELSHITRNKEGDVGPISISEINKSFEKVVGTPPVDESAVMLQRLPSLGRISSDSTDRRFVDYYILDGLRAEHLIEAVYNNQLGILAEYWINPLNKVGIEIVAKKIFSDKSANAFIEFLKMSLNGTNKIVTGDILASLVYYASNSILDLGGIAINKTNISCLNFSRSLIENFTLKDSSISQLDISSICFSRISFKECIITTIYGVPNEEEIPYYISDSLIEHYDANPMEVGDKFLDIKPTQMLFISIINKVFFYNNKLSESDLVSNFGNIQDRATAERIIKLLYKEKIVYKSESNEVYPKSYERKRMLEILKQLSKSKDKLWIKIGKLE